MDSVLREIGELVRTHPTTESTDCEIAAWYAAKARLLIRIASTEAARAATNRAMRLCDQLPAA